MLLVILNIKNDVYLNSFEHYDILISMSIKWPSIIYINPVMRTGIYLEILTDKYLIHHNPLRNAHTGRIRKNVFFSNHKTKFTIITIFDMWCIHRAIVFCIIF